MFWFHEAKIIDELLDCGVAVVVTIVGGLKKDLEVVECDHGGADWE